MRTNLRLVALRDRLCPSEVLPTPGGPTRHRIGAFDLVDALLHREVLEDALLDLLEAVVVLVEHLLGVRRCRCGSCVRFFHGRLDQHVDVVAHHGRLGATSATSA
jgi:hypothetical protein